MTATDQPSKDTQIAALREALGRIADVSERWENSLVSQINEIARAALAGAA